jgi:hypothetical protein
MSSGAVLWEMLGGRISRFRGHDPKGELYVDFQQGLEVLLIRRVLVSIVSKNEKSVVLEAIQNPRAFSVAKVKSMLGYKPEVTLREWIRRTIHW